MENNRPLIIAVDFDGTLVEDKFPDIGEPIREVMDYIKSLKRAGAKIILWTCRNGKALEEALQFCTDHKLYFDAVNKNLPEIQELYGGDTRKVFADVYIDDKAFEAPRYLFRMAEMSHKVQHDLYNKETTTACETLLQAFEALFESAEV